MSEVPSESHQNGNDEEVLDIIAPNQDDEGTKAPSGADIVGDIASNGWYAENKAPTADCTQEAASIEDDFGDFIHVAVEPTAEPPVQTVEQPPNNLSPAFPTNGNQVGDFGDFTHGPTNEEGGGFSQFHTVLSSADDHVNAFHPAPVRPTEQHQANDFVS